MTSPLGAAGSAAKGGGKVVKSIAAAPVLAAVAMLMLVSVVLGGGAGTGAVDANLCATTTGPAGGTAPALSTASLNAEQLANAQTVVSVAAQMHVPSYAATVTLAAALQESKLHNYIAADFIDDPGLQDHDSLGILQQRVSIYTEAVATDPAAATRAFLVRLMGVPNWQIIPLTEAAATVQIPREDLRGEYAKWQTLAEELTATFWPAAAAAAGSGAYDPAAPAPPAPAGSTCGAGAAGPSIAVSTAGWAKPAEGAYTSGFGLRWGTQHRGIDISDPLGTPIYAAFGGTVAAAGPADGFGNWIVLNHMAADGTVFSTVYGHMTAASILVRTGDTVAAGQQIAAIGQEGQSTGPHLHFEVWAGGRLTGGTAIDPLPFMAARGITW